MLHNRNYSRYLFMLISSLTILQFCKAIHKPLNKPSYFFAFIFFFVSLGASAQFSGPTVVTAGSTTVHTIANEFYTTPTAINGTVGNVTPNFNSGSTPTSMSIEVTWSTTATSGSIACGASVQSVVIDPIAPSGNENGEFSGPTVVTAGSTTVHTIAYEFYTTPTAINGTVGNVTPNFNSGSTPTSMSIEVTWSTTATSGSIACGASVQSVVIDPIAPSGNENGEFSGPAAVTAGSTTVHTIAYEFYTTPTAINGTVGNVTPNFNSGSTPTSMSIEVTWSTTATSGSIACGASVQSVVIERFAPSDNENYVASHAYREPLQSDDYSLDSKKTSIVYYDGLGRVTQTHHVKMSPKGRDLISVLGYDDQGRESRKYLPFSVDNSQRAHGSFDSDYESHIQTFYNADANENGVSMESEYFYEEVEFEKSPLNRPSRSFGAGTAWRSESRSLNSYYSINDDNEVRKISIDDGMFVDFGYYTSGSLTKNILVNEDLHQNITFEDAQGRVVLKRQQTEKSTFQNGYEAFNQFWPSNEIAISSGQGGVTIDIADNILTINFNASFSTSSTIPIIGSLFKVNTSPQIRNIAVGDIGGGYIAKIDEDGYLVIEVPPIMPVFITELSKIVTKRLAISTINTGIETYYLYDDAGNMTCVIPPAATEKALQLNDFETLLNDPVFRNRWLFQYKYDGRKRMIEKQVPGASPVYMVYDQRDRLVLTQDGNQRSEGFETLNGNISKNTPPTTNYYIASGSLTLQPGFHATGNFIATTDVNSLSGGKWSFTKYDALNRPVMSGVTAINGTRQDIQDNINLDASNGSYEYIDTYVGNVAGNIFGYDNNAYPDIEEDEVVSVTYYDNHNFLSLSDWFGVDGPNNPYNYTGTITQNTKLKGLTTGGLTKVLGTQNMLPSVTYYDSRYRPIQNISGNHLGGTEKITTKYFNVVSPNVESVSRIHKAGTVTKTIQEEYTYDHMDRLLTTKTTIDGNPSPSTITHSYNEIGELIKKDLNGIQEVDYQYNIRGWLTKINDGTALTGNDVFGMELKYTDAPAGYEQYNGNIGQILWKGVDTSPTTNDNAQSYKYTYDPLNRIKKAEHTSGSTIGNYNVGGNDNGGIRYDANGNILNLNRYQLLNNTKYKIDDLQYSYTSGNQLAGVIDNGQTTAITDPDPQINKVEDYGFRDDPASTANDYTYDANGNMVSDKNKGIVNIDYNFLNLPEYVDLGSGKSVKYIYDASGTKLKKESKDGGNTITTDYISGIHYKNGSLDFIQHTEGRYKFGASSGYEYDLKDHLGNTRSVIMANPNVVRYNQKFDDSDENPPLEVDSDELHFQKYSSAPSCMILQSGESKEIGYQLHEGQILHVEVMTYNPWTEITLRYLSPYGEKIKIKSASGITLNAWEKRELEYEELENLSIIFVTLSTPSFLTGYFDDLKITISEGELYPIQQRDDYYPFGLTFNSAKGSPKNLYTYNGNEEQEETGLIDFNFRTYDAALGRYLQIDPFSKFHESGYAWVTNNPIRFMDPLGLDTIGTNDPVHIDDVILLDPVVVVTPTKSTDDEDDGDDETATQKVGAKVLGDGAEQSPFGEVNAEWNLPTLDYSTLMEWFNALRSGLTKNKDKTGKDKSQDAKTAVEKVLEAEKEYEEHKRGGGDKKEIRATNYPAYQRGKLAEGADGGMASPISENPDSLMETKSYKGNQLIKRDTSRIK